MSEANSDYEKRVYIETVRSTKRKAISVTIYKEYDSDNKPYYYFDNLTRFYKLENGTSGYSSKIWPGYASAIAEVAQDADMRCAVYRDEGQMLPPKVNEKLKERFSPEQLKGVSVEKCRVLEQDYMDIKANGEEGFWKTASEAIAK